MSISIHNIAFAIEILLAELIFLIPARRRPHFALRLALATAFSVAASCLLVFRGGPLPYALLRLLRIVLVFGATVLAMGWCFAIPLPTLITACASGYAVEHICFHITLIIGNTTPLLAGVSGPVARWELLEYLLFPVFYLIFALLAWLFFRKNNGYSEQSARMNGASITLIAVTIGMTRLSDIWRDNLSIIVSFYAVAGCLLALCIQWVMLRAIRLQHENETMRLLWREERRQYELSKKEIETLNIKHHDLKKRLAELNVVLTAQEIDTIAEAVDAYDRKVRTGNEALDVLLTKKNMICRSEGIMIGYVGDASALSFMTAMEVYSLFGNAVDNAVEAVRKLDDPQQKTIDIKVEKTGSMVSMTFTNYFTGELRMQDGLPVTTRTDEEGFHGFGVRSMQNIAEKYGGGLSAVAADGIFTLTVYVFGETHEAA